MQAVTLVAATDAVNRCIGLIAAAPPWAPAITNLPPSVTAQTLVQSGQLVSLNHSRPPSTGPVTIVTAIPRDITRVSRPSLQGNSFRERRT